MPIPVQASSAVEEAGTDGEGTHLLRGGFIIAPAGGDVVLAASPLFFPDVAAISYFVMLPGLRGLGVRFMTSRPSIGLYGLRGNTTPHNSQRCFVPRGGEPS